MRPSNTSSEHSGRMSLIFSLLLLVVFLLSTIFLLLIGSQVYQNIRERNSDCFYSDTASNYIVSKIRQMDAQDAIEIRKEDGQDILVITTEQNEDKFETWIYTKDGSLMELYAPNNSGLTRKDGLPILPCSNVSFTFDTGKNLLGITVETNKKTFHTIHLLLRSNYDKLT